MINNFLCRHPIEYACYKGCREQNKNINLNTKQNTKRRKKTAKIAPDCQLLTRQKNKMKLKYKKHPQTNQRLF